MFYVAAQPPATLIKSSSLQSLEDHGPTEPSALIKTQIRAVYNNHVIHVSVPKQVLKWPAPKHHALLLSLTLLSALPILVHLWWE